MRVRWWERIALPTRGCPPGWRLTRAASEGPDAGLTRHLARCEHCSVEYRGLLSLTNQKDTAFPAPEKMSRESRGAIATRLRNAVPESAGLRRRRWAPLWLAAPIAGLVLGARSSGQARLVCAAVINRILD